MEAIICDTCKKTKKKEETRRVIIHEMKGWRRDADGNYVGHSKLDVCFDCLFKLGYIKRNKEVVDSVKEVKA